MLGGYAATQHWGLQLRNILILFSDRSCMQMLFCISNTLWTPESGSYRLSEESCIRLLI